MATRTFLFVDQVSSTAQLAALGDSEAHSVRRALFDLLRQATQLAGGHEVDFTGDGLFCAFDGAAEAVETAVTMQQLVRSFSQRQPLERRLGIRIGINTGEPLESEGGGYFGIAVVVGARLCSAAEAGQILVADVVRSLVEPRGGIDYTPVGALTLKGVPAPVAAFSVEWVPDDRRPPLPAALTGGPEHFVGRRHELESIRGSLPATDAGGRRLVLVSGDHGIGVTSLLAEAARRFHTGGASVWSGRGAGAGERLAPWSEALLGWAETAPRAQLRLALGDKGTELMRLVPALQRLVPRLPAPARMDAASEVFLIADALDDLCARWGQSEPIVVVLDRLHDADSASLTVLGRLIASARGGSLLILGGYEPSEVGSDRALAALAQLPGAAELPLGGLAAAEIAELVQTITGEPVTAQSLRAVIAESEGSPYFVRHMAVSLRERAVTRKMNVAVERAEELRTDLRLKREEIALGLRQLESLRASDLDSRPPEVDPDGTTPGAGVCPYPGLMPFQPSDRENFFGRELLVAELLSRLVSARFVAVVGASGSGKSSAVRAGLLPRLAQGGLPGSDRWTQMIWTPGSEQAFSAALAGRDGNAEGNGDGTGNGNGLVLVVDQAEQLWIASPAEERGAVLDALTETVAAPDRRVTVVLVLRADYYERLSGHPGVARMVADSQVLMTPMTAAELRSAIEGPARRCGLILEAGLAQAVMDDVGEQAGALALLSTALRETWERRRGHSLTLVGYAETGGVRRAIAQLAETVYAELDPAQQVAARRLLLRLATPGLDDSDVARSAPLAEITGDPAGEQVMTRFAERRLLTVGRSSVQVAHEALLREWPRLRGWLDDDREGRRLDHRIAAAAAEWDAQGRDEAALLRGALLSGAQDRREAGGDHLTALERDFVSASVQARQRELVVARHRARRLQFLAGGLVVLLVMALAAGGYALVQRRTANHRATESDSRGLAAQAQSLSGTHADLALLLAVEGYRRDPSIDSESGLLHALNGARFLSRYHHELPANVTDLAVTADGATLLMLTGDGRLQQWETQTWKPGPALATGIESPSVMSVSHDGERVAYLSSRGVSVVDPRSGDAVGAPFGGADVAGATFADHHDRVVTASASRRGIEVFDTSTGKKTATIAPGLPDAIVDVDPVTDEVVAGSLFHAAALQRFRLDGSAVGAKVTIDALPDIENLAYSPDGSRILVAGDRGALQFVDGTTLQPVGAPFSVRGSRAGDIAFNPSGALAAVGSDDGSITVVDAQFGQSDVRITGLTGDVNIAFLDQNRILASTQTEVAEFDLRDRVAIGHTTITNENVSTLLAPRGSTNLMGNEGDRVATISSSGVETALPALPDGAIIDAIDVSADGKWLAVHGYTTDDLSDGQVWILDLRTSAPMRTVKIPGDSGDSTRTGRIAFSHDGGRLGVGTALGKLAMIDSASARVIFSDLTADSYVISLVTWVNGDSALMVGGQGGVLQFRDPVQGSLLASTSLSPGQDITDARYLPGSDDVAVSSEGGSVYLVNAVTRRLDGAPLSAGGTQLEAVAPGESGTVISALSRDGALRLWDRATRRPIGPPIQAHDTYASAITVNGNGQVVTGGGGAVITWDLTPSGWTRTACRLAGRDLTRAEWQQYLPGQPYRRTCTGSGN